MSIHYKVNDHTFGFSYQQCKQQADRINAMTDDEFMQILPEALHLAVFVCWVKEYPADYLLSDHGLIHELVHLLHIPDATRNIREIREEYKRVVCLI
jgi:hypothetical protein